MHGSEEGMSLHLESNDIQPVSFLCLPLYDYCCISSGGDAPPPPVRGWWSYLEAPGDNVWCTCWNWCSADRFTNSDDVVVAEVGSGCWEYGGRPLGTEKSGGSYGTADAPLTSQAVRWFSSHQPAAPVINRKGSHVKKKPFQLQPLELQCRTHAYIHTSIKHTSSHTNKYTWAWSESKGWFQWQPEWRIKQDIWHLHYSSNVPV